VDVKRGLALDPHEWQTWLHDQYTRAAQQLEEDLSAGRISFMKFQRAREALEEDYVRSARRHPIR
jgi:hypothetical protein